MDEEPPAADADGTSQTTWAKYHVKGSDKTIRQVGTPYWFNSLTGESRWHDPRVTSESRSTTKSGAGCAETSSCPSSCAVCSAERHTVADILESIVKGVESQQLYSAPLRTVGKHVHLCTIYTRGKLDMVLNPDLEVSEIQTNGLAHRHGIRQGMRLMAVQNQRIDSAL